MTANAAPSLRLGDDASGRLLLGGRWTLDHAAAIADLLRDAPAGVRTVDANGVERLDSLGVLQLLRYARRAALDFDGFAFRPEHHALVAAIEDVVDERPRGKREYGVAAALGRLGFAVHDNITGYTGGNIVATFGHPEARRVHALQLEINASLLMTTSRDEFIAHITRGGIPERAEANITRVRGALHELLTVLPPTLAAVAR